MRGGTALLPHQLEALNWLRKRWAASTPCAIADDVGLGKTATIISFLQCLRCQRLHPKGPIWLLPRCLLQHLRLSYFEELFSHEHPDTADLAVPLASCMLYQPLCDRTLFSDISVDACSKRCLCQSPAKPAHFRPA